MAELNTLTAELVNRRYPEFKFQITEQWVRDYKASLGLSYAKINEDTYIPNSFVSCLRDSEFSVFSHLNIELSQLLHASQTFEFVNPMKVGDEISSQSEITKVSYKNGSRGEMVFLDIKNTFTRIAQFGIPVPEATPLVIALMCVVVRPQQ